ncbi:phospholipase D-like domain-containing protein [Roseateles sp. BYS180W]|uniref:Phospholipase D-like domain-containing protein n=1 Tax=Roseateles rivi TaxID=3299028 RepID=A0ABW7FZY8_9BURK
MSSSDPNALKTHQAATTPTARSSPSVQASRQWFLSDGRPASDSHPVRKGSIHTYVCGQEAFQAIAADIEAAHKSIELICWGFDPAMALDRSKPRRPESPWTSGETYGALLERKAAQGVQVRLLVWYNDAGSCVQNNLVGYAQPAYDHYPGGVVAETWAERNRGRIGAAYPLAEQRQDYCTLWWRRATKGHIGNLEVRCRDGVKDAVKASLADEADKPSSEGGQLKGWFDEQKLVEAYATHHQKPILIDFDHNEGATAVGYIMGLNSVTDYWDTSQHEFDSPLREPSGATAADLSKAQEAGALVDAVLPTALRLGLPISRRPYRDYAARLTGEVLVDVNLNFVRAWDRARRLPELKGDGGNSISKVSPPVVENLAGMDPQTKVPRSALSGRRAAPAKLMAACNAKGPIVPLQVLRTQPEEPYADGQTRQAFDKSIKRAYFHATGEARNYLYLENQYFFYEEWARHLKAARLSFLNGVQTAPAASSEARMLHLIVVTPQPENVGMVPRTYDTLKSLGEANSMRNQHEKIEKELQSQKTKFLKFIGPSDIAQSAQKIQAPTHKVDGELVQDGKDLALKVIVCKLATANRASPKALGAARDIYIHSKLMLIDDEYLLLGSANMNQRSMAADSEICVATSHQDHARELRRTIWGQLSGQTINGGAGTPQEVADAFKNFSKLAAGNFDLIRAGKAITGHLVKFVDERVASDRVG